MLAAIYRRFGGEISVESLPDPSPEPDGLVLEVRASGVCRSDWHGWRGDDPDIRVPHVPGHEIAGVVLETGSRVRRFRPGDRVCVPFIAGCGSCGECLKGDSQVCPDQFQPGFHGWGGFAERVALRRADITLARLSEEIDFVDAASLGCRFATAFRAVTSQGRLRGGEWVCVHGCGGVGLAAVMIASALGARVIAVDIREEPLRMARRAGAALALRAGPGRDAGKALGEEIRETSGGGCHLSIDALGHAETCLASIGSLRRRGRHVQVGLMTGAHKRTAIPMDRVIGWELELVGSHGLAAREYPRLLEMVRAGMLMPGELVTRRVSLREGVRVLQGMDRYDLSGVAVIDQFREGWSD